MRSMRCLPHARSVFLAAVALAVLAPALALSVPFAPLRSANAQPAGDATAASESVLGQLDAFRRGDYDAAYAYASAEIHRLFDRRGFETMVRGGYPEIAHSVRAHVTTTRVSPGGRVYLVMSIRGVNGLQIEAIYEVVLEGGAWKINGVLTQPELGDDARSVAIGSWCSPISREPARCSGEAGHLRPRRRSVQARVGGRRNEDSAAPPLRAQCAEGAG